MSQPESQESQEQASCSFWTLYAGQFPKPPSVDELVCQIVGENYPEGVLTDKHGNRLAFSRNIETINWEMIRTIQGALDDLDEFVAESAVARDMDYKTCLDIHLSYDISVREAGRIIHEAIEEGGLILLDQALWDCYRNAGGKKKRQPCGRPSRFIEMW